MMSESNKQQAVNKLTEIVANFTAMISTRMPDDVVDKLKQLKDAETSSMGKIIYHTMFDNMQKAIDLNRPACQDTGEIMFFVNSRALCLLCRKRRRSSENVWAPMLIRLTGNWLRVWQRDGVMSSGLHSMVTSMSLTRQEP